MKKEFFAAFAFALMLTTIASASCDLSVNMLNQDPYPAVPGEYVKVVFQINGTQTPECNRVFFDVVPEYPFSVESNTTRLVVLGGTYISDYSSAILKAYKLRVDKDALDGDNNLKVTYGLSEGGSTSTYTKDFPVNVQDSRTDFDVSIQNYDAANKIITFGIVNIGKRNVEALTLEVPEQDNIKLTGASKTIIGSLNSNDDTTASIGGIPNDGEILVRLTYNDQINVRRTVEKEVDFSTRYLTNGANAVQPKSGYYYLFWLLVIVLIGYWIYRYFQNKKAKNNKIAMMSKR